MLDTPEILPPITERIGEFGQDKFMLPYVVGTLVCIAVVISFALSLIRPGRGRSH